MSAPGTREVTLSEMQRRELAPLRAKFEAAQQNYHAALRLIGVDPSRVVAYDGQTGVLTVTEPPEPESED